MNNSAPSLANGQVFVFAGLGGVRIHVANARAHRTHCGRLLPLPVEAAEQAETEPVELNDVCRRCAERILSLATALGLV